MDGLRLLIVSDESSHSTTPSPSVFTPPPSVFTSEFSTSRKPFPVIGIDSLTFSETDFEPHKMQKLVVQFMKALKRISTAQQRSYDSTSIIMKEFDGDSHIFALVIIFGAIMRCDDEVKKAWRDLYASCAKVELQIRNEQKKLKECLDAIDEILNTEATKDLRPIEKEIILDCIRQLEK